MTQYRPREASKDWSGIDSQGDGNLMSLRALQWSVGKPCFQLGGTYSDRTSPFEARHTATGLVVTVFFAWFEKAYLAGSILTRTVLLLHNIRSSDAMHPQKMVPAQIIMQLTRLPWSMYYQTAAMVMSFDTPLAEDGTCWAGATR